MAVGRYPLRSAYAYRAKRGSTRLSNLTGSTIKASNPIPFIAWWLGNDGITASDVFDKGYVTLKRWTGTQWVAATLKIRKY